MDKKESPIPPDTTLDLHGLGVSRFPLRSEIHVAGEEGVWEVQSIFQNAEGNQVITACPRIRAVPARLDAPKTFLVSDCTPVSH